MSIYYLKEEKMKNYTLYLIRHGITQGNLEGRYIGLTDLPLCDEGFYAVTRLAHEHLYPDVQKVYSSPLKRCLETVDIIYPDRYVKEIDNIAECDFGEWENKTAAELEGLPEYAQWLKGGYESSAPGGETMEEFTLRCLDGLEEIFKDMIHDEVTRAAVVTHAGVIMNLCANYGLPKGRPADFAIGQGECIQIALSTFMWQHGPVFEIVGRVV